MVVTMLQVIIEFPHALNLKDKRRELLSIKDRLIRKFHLSVAEVDLQDSIRFTQIGAALVSNSKEHGEKVMQHAITFIEDSVNGRVQNVEVLTDFF